MPVFTDYTFRSSDGAHDIHVRQCLPDGEARAVLQIAHGVAEHIERYDDFARFLAENGIAVVGNDHLGHGRSVSDADELGWFSESDGWRYVVDDMKRLGELTAERFPRKPYFLFGHSMGSFLTRTYLIRYPGGLTGCILSGTGQQPALISAAGAALAQVEIKRHGSKYKSPMLQRMAFGSYNKGLEARTASDWLSRDTAMVDAYEADPLCGFSSSAALFRDICTAFSFNSAPQNLAAMDKALPVLFMSGARDPVGDCGRGVKKAYELYKRAGMRELSIKLYPDGRHEMLNELNRAEVFRDVLTWLNRLI